MIGRLLKNRRAGDITLAWHRPGLSAPETIILRSASFHDDGAIPQRFAARPVGPNVSPHLAWSGAPDETQELVLLIEDPDVPFRRPIAHLALAGIPPVEVEFAEGALNKGASPFGTGRGSFGREGYAGPRPIPGHGPHAYVFQLFALDSSLALPVDASPDAIIQAMDGHVVGRGRLTGYYER
jgi:Raf kinase inhibitor-like YbhB/YbcL family protein